MDGGMNVCAGCVYGVLPCFSGLETTFGMRVRNNDILTAISMGLINTRLDTYGREIAACVILLFLFGAAAVKQLTNLIAFIG